jgi:Sel1 repeat-containing protein
MKIFLLVAALLCPVLTLAADQPSLVELDRVIMRVPPSPRKWETNLTSLTAAAEKGDVNAQLDLGLHYVFAVGTTQNLEKALQWVTNSAAQKFPPAEYTLGMMYKSGVGVVSNQVTADAWFQKAADQGHTPSKHEAALTADRKGKRAEALKLLREAAEKGFPSSEYLMGRVVTDPVESYVWHSLAAPNVELASTRQLELRQQLTKEQLAEAEERIRQFRVKQASEPPAKR